MYTTPKIPKWMEELPGHVLLNSLEIAEIYGVHKSSVSRCIVRGTIPRPSLIMKMENKNRDRFKWRFSDIKKSIAPNVKLRGAALLRRPARTPGWAVHYTLRSSLSNQTSIWLGANRTRQPGARARYGMISGQRSARCCT